MTRFENATPRPWQAFSGEHPGTYEIIGRRGPIRVQPAKAFGRDDAELITAAVNAHEALVEAAEQDAELFRQLAEWAKDHEMPADAEAYIFRAEVLELAAKNARGEQS